jgi:hypothetical protein
MVELPTEMEPSINGLVTNPKGGIQHGTTIHNPSISKPLGISFFEKML